MKKIFAIIMTICLLASALCIAALAAEPADGVALTVHGQKKDGTTVKIEDLPVKVGDTGDTGSLPGLGRYWGEGNEKEMALASIFLPGKFHGQRSLASYSL